MLKLYIYIHTPKHASLSVLWPEVRSSWRHQRMQLAQIRERPHEEHHCQCQRHRASPHRPVLLRRKPPEHGSGHKRRYHHAQHCVSAHLLVSCPLSCCLATDDCLSGQHVPAHSLLSVCLSICLSVWLLLSLHSSPLLSVLLPSLQLHLLSLVQHPQHTRAERRGGESDTRIENDAAIAGRADGALGALFKKHTGHGGTQGVADAS